MSEIIYFEYEDTGKKIPTIMLGNGDVLISGIVEHDDGLCGVAFSSIDNNIIGKPYPEVSGKQITDTDVIFQIMSSSRESLQIIKDKLDEAIEALYNQRSNTEANE